MARYKDYNYDQSKLLPINFSEQILPGTFGKLRGQSPFSL